MYEDGRKSNILREQLNSMKEEKQLLADRLHEIERQLHIANMNLKRMHELESQLFVAKEALVKYQLEEEVNHSSLSSNSSKNAYIGSFEKHTRGIGSKLMSKIVYEGKGLGKHAKGIIEPIMVVERPKYLGLGYGQSYGESSKAAMKAIEIAQIRSCITECEDCVQEECNSSKHQLQDEGVKKHTIEPESCGNSNNLEEIDGVPKGATSSFASPTYR